MKSVLQSIVLLALLGTTASAADVDSRISTRETYVGRPVVLQLSIVDAATYEEPVVPSIDGCDIRSMGPPREMSQVTIINGRRSERRSAMKQYLVTPRREGTFTIPAMTLQVDGKTVSTKPQRFVATTSETGDMMFVKIEGGKKKVFVGQPLDLTLKISIKPFHDDATDQTLSEGDMWSTISDSTRWGGFTDRIKTLEKNGQRPGGEEVLRDDGTGHQRSYYSYRIDATVYPKRAGKIDAEDVQIVVNYPTKLGRTRSPFGGSFADDFFGGHSPMSRMMDDDFFGSPFSRRLAITESRPIVGDVQVDATEVLPVPTTGRPDDYRGAVGQYRLLTQATPTTVDAGDPITLNIVIQGTGPMDLVQAPPLTTMSELTKEFKVPDETLAGFVKDGTKFFSTTIRPRRAGIERIPPIRFSFFNPDTEKFETVTSDAIAITVNESETLALDAIVSGARGSSPGAEQGAIDQSLPNFANFSGASVLTNQSPHADTNGWWAFVIVPPFVWIGAVVLKNWAAMTARMPSFRSPKAKCLTAIDRAQGSDGVKDALAAFILKRKATRTNMQAVRAADGSDSLATQAVGELRLAGLYQVAGEVESFMAPSHSIGTASFDNITATAKALVERVGVAISANKMSRVKRAKPQPPMNSAAGTNAKTSLHRTASLLLALSVTCLAATTSIAADTPGTLDSAPVHATNASIESATLGDETAFLKLSPEQQATLLGEATEAYKQGIAKSKSDSADAKELLATARTKYQMLVDSGIHNAELYSNLGNADLQTGRLGHAIANYEQALVFASRNAQVRRNLAFADKKVEETVPKASSTTGLRSINAKMVHAVGAETLIWVLALSSMTFWGLLMLRVVHRRFPIWRCAAVPLFVLLTSLSSVLLTETSPRFVWNAVMVTDNVSLHTGDGEEFDSVIILDAAQGHRVEVLGHRGKWSRVRTREGHTGWVHDRDVQIVSAA